MGGEGEWAACWIALIRSWIAELKERWVWWRQSGYERGPYPSAIWKAIRLCIRARFGLPESREYIGGCGGDGWRVGVVRRAPGCPARGHLLTHHIHHSPDGFDWGYSGSRPTDLAIALLADAASKLFDDAEERPVPACFYRQFEDEVVSRLPREGWIMKRADVLEWLVHVMAGAKGVSSGWRYPAYGEWLKDWKDPAAPWLPLVYPLDRELGEAMIAACSPPTEAAPVRGTAVERPALPGPVAPAPRPAGAKPVAAGLGPPGRFTAEAEAAKQRIAARRQQAQRKANPCENPPGPT
jgi:hypothetical protein